MFPAMLMAIPLYIILSALQMRNTYTGLILAHMAISLPLNIWIMWQYFQIVPMSLEEAAWVCGRQPAEGPPGGVPALGQARGSCPWPSFPLPSPGMTSPSPLFLQTDKKMFTLPIGLATFVEQTAHPLGHGHVLRGSGLGARPLPWCSFCSDTC